ncbi:MAG: hypothetical protein GEU96_08710 [Propionibacteriales bacterium]|nr:hypothetical protein [Propionibacteriales bacterium]
MSLLRRIAALTAGIAFTLITLASPAHAADGFTYWGYYHLADGAWVPADTGPDGFTPEDGSVEGWHFATTAEAPSRPPRTDASFDEVCKGTDAADGEKRVAVLVDFGVAEEAPDGDTPPDPEAYCAVAPADANGQQVLESVAEVRVDDGLTCGIDGYPTTACSVTVADATVPETEEPVEFALPAAATEETATKEAASESDGDSDAPWALIGVGALLVVMIAGGAVVAKRRA